MIVLVLRDCKAALLLVVQSYVWVLNLRRDSVELGGCSVL